MQSVDLFIFWLKCFLFSAENSFHEENYHNEEDPFASEEGNDSMGDQSNHRVQSNSIYFNYQSFMKKTPTVRWSKQETELFYEVHV